MSETTPTPQSETKPVTHHVSPPASQSPAPVSTTTSSGLPPQSTTAPSTLKPDSVTVIPASTTEPKKVGAFVIEDGIEIPPTGPPKKSSEFADVLKALKVGQSFTVSQDKAPAVRSAAKSLDVRVALRKAGDYKVRVWRIAEEVGA